MVRVMLSQIGKIIIQSSVITNRLSITIAALIIDYVLAPISQPDKCLDDIFSLYVAYMFLLSSVERPHLKLITKTCLYNFDPLKPHFYIVKLGFTGVYIIFLISSQNIGCGYSLEPPRRGGSNE